MRQPLHGVTKHGQQVHGRVIDHHREDTAYQRFNKRAALWLTAHVGTMTCAWVFTVISLASLPATLVAAHVVSEHLIVPSVLASAGFILVVSWVAQSYLQLFLLPALMVGQNLQNEAADARSAKTFDDTEAILNLLNTKTEGGLQEVLAAIHELHAKQPSA